jgi:hypothetical protein
MPAHDWKLQENVAPSILAKENIGSWEHEDCGTCWMLTNDDLGTAMMALAIDGSDKGLKTSLKRLDWLTKGRALELGSSEVNMTRADISEYGYSPDTAAIKEDL